ncbi:MAG: hypothetical protein JWM03_1254 [Rhodocyclales bacterium]|nr:hypothetical protein [Rhodocyclales bacterium]
MWHVNDDLSLGTQKKRGALGAPFFMTEATYCSAATTASPIAEQEIFSVPAS